MIEMTGNQGACRNSSPFQCSEQKSCKHAGMQERPKSNRAELLLQV